jgi:hypothetical protein
VEARRVDGRPAAVGGGGGDFRSTPDAGPPPPSPAELDSGRRALLALINSSREQHLRVHGEYPEDLNAVLPIQVEVGYRRTQDGYEASVRLSDGQLVKVKKP